MAHGVDDDLSLRWLVENQIGVWRYAHPANGRVVRAAADDWVLQQQIGKSFDAELDPPRTLRRMRGDVIEDRAKIGKGRKCVAMSRESSIVMARPFALDGPDGYREAT